VTAWTICSFAAELPGGIGQPVLIVSFPGGQVFTIAPTN
jgi:hypothetical protein